MLILCAVRWYLRYSHSFRDVEELLRERDLEVDHTTIWRWIQRYGPDLKGRLRRHLKPTTHPGVSMRPTFVSGALVLPLPSPRFYRRYDRLLALGAARCRAATRLFASH